MSGLGEAGHKLEIKCPKGQTAVYACASSKCDHNAFCCKEANCCQKIIKPKCELIKISDLLTMHQASTSQLDSIYQSTVDFFQNTIAMVEHEMKNFKDWSEKSFAVRKVFQKIDYSSISTDELSRIMDSLRQYSYEYFEDINAYLKLWDKNLREQFVEMSLILCDKTRKKITNESRSSARNPSYSVNKNYSFTNLTTRILTMQNQKQVLYDILNYIKNVRSVNLLYHAGSHDFSVAKFHEMCDGIPNTLVIIRNQKDKVYGGFSPMPWGKPKLEKFITDESLKTVVFSISNKKKYTLRQREKNYAIEWNSLFGPIFGRCNMIQVWDRANREASYWEHTPLTFRPAHGDWNNEMYEEMLGVSKYEYFRLLDWEVFQVLFE